MQTTKETETATGQDEIEGRLALRERQREREGGDERGAGIVMGQTEAVGGHREIS